jgi:predicted alternative tryptophan synthase beta-subunit
LNIIKSVWSVLEARARNRFPLPTSLKQLEDVLQEERYKIQLETVQNLYMSIPKRITAVLKAKGGPTPYYKEMYSVFVVFPLFYPTVVCM